MDLSKIETVFDTNEELKEAISLWFGNRKESCKKYGSMVLWNIKKIRLITQETFWVKYGTDLEKKLKNDISYREGDVIPSFISNYLDSKFKKYLPWVITGYISDGISLYEDILSTTKDALEDYVILKDIKNTKKFLKELTRKYEKIKTMQ